MKNRIVNELLRESVIRNLEDKVADNEKLIEKAKTIRKKVKESENKAASSRIDSQLESKEELSINNSTDTNSLAAATPDEMEKKDQTLSTPPDITNISTLNAPYTEIPILKEEKSDNLTTIIIPEKEDDVNRLDDLVIKKTESKPNPPVPKEQPKPRYIIKKKVTRVTDEEIPSDIIEKKYNELKRKDKFDETFNDIHKTVKDIDSRVCKSGECTERELSKIGKEIEKLDDLKKNFDTTTSELTNLRKDFTDLKKELPKLDICPDCGEKTVLHLSSFCSNCGSKMTEWTDDNGNKIPGWRPYWEKNKK